jgi:hypothetical protein
MSHWQFASVLVGEVLHKYVDTKGGEQPRVCRGFWQVSGMSFNHLVAQTWRCEAYESKLCQSDLRGQRHFWSQLAEQVCHPNVRDKTKNCQTELQETTGAYVLGSPSSRLPQTHQKRALSLVTSSSGDLLQQNTQVSGRILVLASDTLTFNQVLFF